MTPTPAKRDEAAMKHAERRRGTNSTPEEIAMARRDLETLNAAIRMLNEQYLADTECSGEMAWACVECRAVRLRTDLRSFAYELADLYRLPMDDEVA